MDEKKITGLSEEEQAWIDLDVTWGEKDPTVKKMINAAREGDTLGLTTLKARIRTRKQEVLAMQKALDAEKKSKADDEAKKCGQKQRQLFLPGVSEAMAAQPNALARSSLFAPVVSGKRKFLSEVKLVSRKDVVIEYTGIQLNEDHADICMQLIQNQLTSGVETGKFVYFEAIQFLKQLNWSTGGGAYDKLRRYMKELSTASLIIETYKPDGSLKLKIVGSGNLDDDPNAETPVIEDLDVDTTTQETTKRKKELPTAESFRLVEKFISGKGGKMYAYRLDPDWVNLFSNKEYALIDWEKRKRIPKKMQLAKSLQRLLCTSNESPQRFSLDFLKDISQYTGRIGDFIEALELALEELRRIDEVKEWKIGTSTKKKKQVTIWTKVDDTDPID